MNRECKSCGAFKSEAGTACAFCSDPDRLARPTPDITAHGSDENVGLTLTPVGQAKLITTPPAQPEPGAGELEVVAWHKMSDAQPEPGRKFVATYDDGSGAWLGFAHDGGVIDADGDDHTKMPNAEWWAYLPSGFELVCEGYPDEAFDLPPHVCPPIFTQAQAEIARLEGEVARVREQLSRTQQSVVSYRARALSAEADAAKVTKQREYQKIRIEQLERMVIDRDAQIKAQTERRA